MADKKIIEQMLEHLVNDDQAKAEELFHEYVVSKSREIYEDLIESEISEESKEEDEEDKEVDEAAKDEDAEDEKVDEASESDEDAEVEEGFEDIAIEADNEMGGDATDDLASELDAEEEQGEFDGEEEKEAFEPELETVREYVEKVPAGHGAEKKGAAEKADNTTSTVAGKNDMGGTTANIAKAQEDNSSKGTAGGLAGNKAKEDNAGNVNVPGGKAADSLKKETSGHGAEKKGAAEQADNTNSLFRNKR